MFTEDWYRVGMLLLCVPTGIVFVTRWLVRRQRKRDAMMAQDFVETLGKPAAIKLEELKARIDVEPADGA